MKPSTLCIAELNDQLRTTFRGGEILITSGIAALDDASRSLVLARVQGFDTFTPDNDPYGEHDFGAIDLPDVEKVFWKIDCYGPTFDHASEDPSNRWITRRVLTIMLASEY